MKLTTIGFVFARGGSKGIPGKNLRLVGGKPLVAHAVECALASRYISRVVISSDDPEIVAAAREHGAEAPFLRPAELAGDKAVEWHAWQHAIRAVEASSDFPPLEIFVSIPPTSPLREPGDIDRCIEGLCQTGADAAITVFPASRNPHFNQVALDAQSMAQLVLPPPQGGWFGRQGPPTVYDMTTVAYAARPGFVLSADFIWGGRVTAVEVPQERALDIDTEHDLLIARLLMGNKEEDQRHDPA